ncbi:hypothetical protein DL93DRAFT_2232459 [Clavulina sp. PMI_390]|nr:hypothetical protein DL93DRAFT_2232459 [Clavulina sp. PMI_390]
MLWPFVAVWAAFAALGILEAHAYDGRQACPRTTTAASLHWRLAFGAVLHNITIASTMPQCVPISVLYTPR